MSGEKRLLPYDARQFALGELGSMLARAAELAGMLDLPAIEADARDAAVVAVQIAQREIQEQKAAHDESLRGAAAKERDYFRRGNCL